LANGAYALTATATDYLNQSTTAQINVTVTNGPVPTLNLTAPVSGATVSGSSVSFAANASSTLTGNLSVQFQIDSVNFGSPISASGANPTVNATATWDATKVANGPHTVGAIATDVLGQTTARSVSVTVINPAPVINTLTPTGLAYGSNQTVSVTVTSAVGVASVQYKLDGANLGSAVTAGPNFTLSWNTTTVANGTHSLSAVATDLFGQTSATVSNSLTVSNASASFASFDVATSGNWVGVYGQEGFAIAQDASNSLPSYATLLNNGQTYLYTSPDNRALQVSPSQTGTRIESVYYNPAQGSTFTLNLNLTDNTVVHRVAMYFADYDGSSRVQTVSILDARSLAVLDTQTISSFHGGIYGLWDLKGDILVRITNTTNQEPVVSGFFFQTAPAVTITAPAAGSVSGNVTITATAGSSVGINNVQFQVDGVNLNAPITGAGPYSTSWSSSSAASGPHVLTAVATDVNGLVTTSAPVTVLVANAGTGATFVKFDTATSGGWKGVYGQDGEYIANETQNAVPSYVYAQNLVVNGGTLYAWLDTQPDDCNATRGLDTVTLGSGPCNGTVVGGFQTTTTSHNPSAWYSATSQTIRVTITDGRAHQVALYCTDFDTNNLRTQDIEVRDATTSTLLDKRSLASFKNGAYLVWNITGDVTIKATYTGPQGQGYSNAVFSGLFFRTFSTAAPAVNITSPLNSATVAGSINLTATATSGAGIASVRFQLDGSDLLSSIATSPYTEHWITNTSSNGSHTLTAIATDTNGQTTVSAPVTITVNNGAPPAAAAQFVVTDSITSGNWPSGVYGVDGFIIPGDTAGGAADYATVSLNGATTYVWPGANPSSDPTALLKTAASATTDRISSDFLQPYNGAASNILIDVNLIDGAQHQVALYFLDWHQASARSAQVQILDATTSAVLNTQTVGLFGNGKYLVWKLTGHVQLKITEIDTGSNSVAVSGIFFDPVH
jgi:hypothetical protein